MTFLDELQAGRARAEDVGAWVERWHRVEEPDATALHEWLGLSWPEFWHWGTHGELPDLQQRREPWAFVRLHGGQIIWAHGPLVCHRPCAVHWPSRHHMRNWVQNWRDDRGVMERICEHGVGHPDPDDFRLRSGDDPGVHGCCVEGCCSRRRRSIGALEAVRG